MRNAEGKGLGVFATRDIAGGTDILVEEPIFVIKKHEDSIEVADVLNVYPKLSTDAKMKFARLRSALDYTNWNDFKDLGVNSDNVDPKRWVWITYYSNKHTILNGKTGEDSTGVYHVCSLFNHSCLPNAWIGSDIGGRRTCRVFRDIEMGEEITFSYDVAAMFMTTSERALNFPGLGLPQPCECQLCSCPAQERTVSDMRRCLLRHLYIFTHAGEDLDVPHKLDTAKILADTHRVPKEGLAARHTVHLWLFAKLAEAEGVIGGQFTYVCTPENSVCM